MRLPWVSTLVLAVAGVLQLPAAADDRLAGYWVTAPDQSEQAAFSFSILGRWTIVSQHWNGAPSDFKVKYTAVAEGPGGTLTADEPLDKLPNAPRTIDYEIQGGDLLLMFPGTEHADRYRLVKGTPPAGAHHSAVPVAHPKPAPAKLPSAASATPPSATAVPLLGSWVTEPAAPVHVELFIARTKAIAGVRINQEWIKGSDTPVVSRAGNYTVSYAAGHGTLTKDKSDFEGSEIPMLLNFAFVGDALVITVDDGAFAGQHRLVKKSK